MLDLKRQYQTIGESTDGRNNHSGDNNTDISEENYYETSNSSLNGDLSNMTFYCNNITDNPDNYEVARTISWILIVISIFTYAFLTITYFQVLESLTKLFKSGLCCVRNSTDGTVVGRS